MGSRLQLLRLLRRDNNARFFLVEKCIRFLFWSKVEAACGLETVITVITVIESPYDHMDTWTSTTWTFSSSSSSESESSPSVVKFFLAYLGPCVL
jgi:hypothetical protein